MMKKNLILLLILLLLYSKLTQAGFVFDDRFLIVQNDSWKLERIWFSELWGDSEDRTGFYRPLFLCSIYLDRLFFDLEPLGYHIHSLAWQLLSVLGFWLILSHKKEYFGFSEIDIMAAVSIFSFHPFCAETTYWISARNDSMCLGFSLFSIFFIWRERPKWFLGGVCFLAALLSKETALALLPALLFLQSKHRKKIVLFFGVILVSFIFYRNMVLEGAKVLQLQNLYTRTVPLVLFEQFSRLWLPLHLSPVQTLQWFSFYWWKGLLAATTLFLLGKLFWSDPRVRFWIVFGLGAMSLTIPPMMHTGLFGDRYWIYLLPMWGIVLMLTFDWKICIPLLLVWSPFIWVQGDVWKDDYSFWEYQYSQAQNSFTSVSFAHISYEKGYLMQAYQLYQQGYSDPQPYVYGCDNFLTLALKLEGSKRVIEASSWLERIGCDWGGTGWGILGVAYAVENRWNEVYDILQKDHKDPHRRLDLVEAIVFLREGKEEEFCKIWKSWSNSDNLERQIQIVSPDVAILECHE